MRRSTATLAAAIALMAGAALATPAAESIGPAVNAVRAQGGLPAMAQDPRLMAAAQAYAETMAASGRFDHVGADGSTQITRAQAHGCRTRFVGEDIAGGQRTAQGAFESWMGSAMHRSNVVNPSYGAFGVGEAGGMWVIMFVDRC